MRLSYRGAEYEPELTPVETIDRGVLGQYRGQTFSVRYPRHIPAQPVHTLSYRGVTYATMPDGSRMTVPGRLRTSDRLPQCAADTYAIGRSIGSRLQPVQRENLESVHRQNIYRRLTQRIQAAQQQGDQRLLQQLEREMNQLV